MADEDPKFAAPEAKGDPKAEKPVGPKKPRNRGKGKGGKSPSAPAKLVRSELSGSLSTMVSDHLAFGIIEDFDYSQRHVAVQTAYELNFDLTDGTLGTGPAASMVEFWTNKYYELRVKAEQTRFRPRVVRLTAPLSMRDYMENLTAHLVNMQVLLDLKELGDIYPALDAIRDNIVQEEERIIGLRDAFRKRSMPQQFVSAVYEHCRPRAQSIYGPVHFSFVIGGPSPITELEGRQDLNTAANVQAIVAKAAAALILLIDSDDEGAIDRLFTHLYQEVTMPEPGIVKRDLWDMYANFGVFARDTGLAAQGMAYPLITPDTPLWFMSNGTLPDNWDTLLRPNVGFDGTVIQADPVAKVKFGMLSLQGGGGFNQSVYTRAGGFLATTTDTTAAQTAVTIDLSIALSRYRYGAMARRAGIVVADFDGNTHMEFPGVKDIVGISLRDLFLASQNTMNTWFGLNADRQRQGGKQADTKSTTFGT